MPARAMLAILALALAIRLVNVATMPMRPGVLLAGDANEYWSVAQTLFESGHFGRYLGGAFVPETDRVPIYFIFLAAVRWLAGPSFTAALIAQSMIDALTCVVIGALGARLAPAIGIAAGLLAAIWPNLVIHSGAVLTESLFLLPFAGMLYAAARFVPTGSRDWAVIAGLLLGLANMIRPVAQLLPVAMVPIAFAVPLRHRLGWRRAVAAAVAFAVAALLPLAPVLFRNVTEHGALALQSGNGKHLLWFVVPRVRTAEDGSPRSATVALLADRLSERLTLQNLDWDRLDPFERSRLETAVAMDELGRASWTAIVGAWMNGAAIDLLSPALILDPRIHAMRHPSFVEVPGNTLALRARRYLEASPPLYAAVLVTGLVAALVASLVQLYGFVIVMRRWPWAALFAVACILYILLISGPVASARLRMPLEPIFIVLSATALVDIAKRLRQRSIRSSSGDGGPSRMRPITPPEQIGSPR